MGVPEQPPLAAMPTHLATGERRSATPKILVLGAGFAGQHVVRELVRLLPKEEDGRITLVDQHNYLLYTPMLTEVAGGTIDTRHVVSAIRHLSPRVAFEQGSIGRIDLEQKRVTLTTGDTEQEIPATTRTLDADHLVIALGSVTNYHHLPGIEGHSLTMKTLSDAAAIRNRALTLLEAANAEPDVTKRRPLLTFVVAGGGFSGTETMAALNDMCRDEVRWYPNLRLQEIRSVLVQPEPRLLPEISERLAAYAQRQLQRRGVQVRLHTSIDSAGEGYVQLQGGERIQTHLLVWTAGVTPSPVVGSLDCRRGQHGGVVVNASCQVEGHRDVWALGDCAEVPKPDGPGTYAATAQNAGREGTLVARNIVAGLRGEPPRPFTYHPIGELAVVGKRSAVASLYGFRFAGLLAWLLWRGIYLAKLPRMAARLRVATDWLLDLTFGRELAELPGARRRRGASQTI